MTDARTPSRAPSKVGGSDDVTDEQWANADIVRNTPDHGTREAKGLLRAFR